MNRVDHARRLLVDAIARRVFPAAVVDVGSSGGVLWRDAVGTLSSEAGAPPVVEATAFDLASLTKVIATTTVIMDLVRSGAARLDDRVADYFP